MPPPRPPAPSTPAVPGVRFTEALRQIWVGPFTPMANARAQTRDGTTVSVLIIREDEEYDADSTPCYDRTRDEAANISRFLRTPTPYATLSNGSLADMLCQVIWGSNAIEGVGADFYTTNRICRPLFLSTHRVKRNVRLRLAYLAGMRNTVIEYFVRHNLSVDAWTVRRCEREILDHALAAMYLFNHAAVEEKELTMETLVETHGILTQGFHGADGVSWCDWSGCDREYHTTSCGDRIWCVDMGRLQQFLERLAEILRRKVRSAVETGRIDPIALAAQCCQLSYVFHAAHGGDRRLSRLIMNALLLKYGGIVVAVGADQHLDQYQDIMGRLRSMALQYVDRGYDTWEGAHKELPSFLLRQVYATLKRWRKALEAET